MYPYRYRSALGVATNVFKLLIAIALLAVAGIAIAVTMSDGPEYAEAPEQDYYYDLNTGELFAAPYRERLPAANPATPNAAPAGVIAYVFACGDCTAESDRFIAYLEVHDPRPTAPAPARIAAKPDGGHPQWLDPRSPQAKQLRDVASRCNGAEPVRCRP